MQEEKGAWKAADLGVVQEVVYTRVAWDQNFLRGYQKEEASRV
jgi:hypothetical protein